MDDERITNEKSMDTGGLRKPNCKACFAFHWSLVMLQILKLRGLQWNIFTMIQQVVLTEWRTAGGLGTSPKHPGRCRDFEGQTVTSTFVHLIMAAV